MNQIFKLIISILIAAVLLVGIWFAAGKIDSAADDTILTEQTIVSDQNAVGSDLLLLIDQLKNLNFDVSIVTEPAFRNLEDFSPELGETELGRENPFLPA